MVGSRRLWLAGSLALGWLVLGAVALVQALRIGGTAWLLVVVAFALVLANASLFVVALLRRPPAGPPAGPSPSPPPRRPG